ncbi:MAG: phosphoribosylanthranilate isomerase [Haloarculaceae archaeon]
MTRVKLCGLTNERDLDAAVATGADAVGVIADVPVETPREVPVDAAADLVGRVPPLVTSVLVTMPDDAGAAADLVARIRPDALQVNGCDPETVAAIRERLSVPVLAAVDAAADVAAYADGADAVLLDSTGDRGAGGTGEVHDWDRARAQVEALDVPVVLAGGLTPTNVGDAVDRVAPFAVDVASGVEAAGGRKDHDAMQQFVRRATERREVAR